MKIELHKIFLIVTIIGILSIFYFLEGPQYLTIESLKLNQLALKSLYKNHSIAFTTAFFFGYILITALSIPVATILSLGAGSVFGFWPGLIFVSFASSLGASLSFLAARYFLRNSVQSKFGHLLKKVNIGLEEKGWLYLISLRLMPIAPFFLINLIFGLTKIKLLSFYIASQIGMFAGTAIYVNAGVQLSTIDSMESIASPKVLLSLFLLGLLPLLTAVLKSRKA